jgi:hypothetical protein
MIKPMGKKNTVIVRWNAEGRPQFYAGGNLAPWAEEYPIAIKYTERTGVYTATSKNLGPCAVVTNYGQADEKQISVAQQPK